MMITNKVDSGTREQTLTNIHSGTEDESRVCNGNYIGVVRSATISPPLPMPSRNLWMR
jgi:hypothetical protein